MARRRSFVVLQSYPRPRPTTNPYVVMLAESLQAMPTVDLRYFSWKQALFGRYDVFHVHWPEILVGGNGVAKKTVRQVLFCLLMLKLLLTRTAVVRTLHNLHLPDGISAFETYLLQTFELQASFFIVLNSHTPLPHDRPHSLILHGHYRHWYSEYVRSTGVPHRLGYFGLIRRYKNVLALVSTFRGTRQDLPDVTLTVAGHPSSMELAAELKAAAVLDDRLELRLGFMSDQELVTVVTESPLIVLPYREMHNSGGVLTSLSLNRAVLVPDNLVNRDLREEVGEQWVLLYEGDLDGEDLRRSLAIAAQNGNGEPDLSGREWEPAGADHMLAYHRAVEHRRTRGARLLQRGSNAKRRSRLRLAFPRKSER